MANKKPIDYQRLSQKLDEVVTELQDETTTIDKSLELYEEATQLIAQMEAYLKTAENRLRKVVPRAKAS